MRFDDGLDTVLAGEMAGPAGIQSMWRQVVDLIGRRRGGPTAAAITRLRMIRDDVPLAVRAASARGLERAHPPATLVALFADDVTEVAAPVIRSARLSANEWIALLPTMRPATRGVLRHRRDLSDTVLGALAGFGPSDFALTAGDLTDALIERAPAVGLWPPVAASEAVTEPQVTVWPPEAPPLDEPIPEPATTVWPPEPVDKEPIVEAPAPVWLPESVIEPDAETPVADGPAAVWPPAEPATAPELEPGFVAPEPMPFVAVADVARELPVVAEALRREREEAALEAPRGDFAISEIVARIEAHQRATEGRPMIAAVVNDMPDRFRFETDARGVVRWTDSVVRGPLIGLSLAAGRDGAPATADGSAGGALLRRARFADARLQVPGTSPVSGTWRISAMPVFDHASGRFTGYRGTARRPRPDEAPQVAGANAAADSLRQLVHELRTPANAISGFAEMIERELLGPVPPAYRARAAEIVGQTAGLLGAIDDIDTAARLESRSLELRAETVLLMPLFGRVMRDLQPLSELRGATLSRDVPAGAAVTADVRALERLFSRLLTALVASAGRGEAVTGSVVTDGDVVRCDFSRPAALAVPDGALFSADAEVEAATAGAPLLGGGFAFRLARKLIAELGGSTTIGPESLTVRLPAAVHSGVEQATV